jgi:NAD(P)-dependent dehydrogenase (short-subunit alcohol dehydrogenase family)
MTGDSTGQLQWRRSMSEQPLQGKVAIVTGAASDLGLGRAMTLALVHAGARVMMMDVDAQGLERGASLLREVGGSTCVQTIVGDVGKPEDAERAVQMAIAELGGLHILVNNAGINPRIDPGSSGLVFSNIPPDSWLRTISVNVNGPFFMARAAVGHLVAQGWGRIIGVTTSLDTMIRGAPYGPSKAAHEALVAVIAREVEGTGVTANVLIPGGAVSTNMVPDHDRPGLLAPEVMQAPVVWLASAASDGINGRRLIAQFWDEELPLEERLAKAAAPAAWPQLGRQASR